MKKVGEVFRELGRLYDFQKELAKLRFRDEGKPSGVAAADRKGGALGRRSADRCE